MTGNLDTKTRRSRSFGDVEGRQRVSSFERIPWHCQQHVPPIVLQDSTFAKDLPQKEVCRKGRWAVDKALQPPIPCHGGKGQRVIDQIVFCNSFLYSLSCSASKHGYLCYFLHPQAYITAVSNKSCLLSTPKPTPLKGLEKRGRFFGFQNHWHMIKKRNK